MEDVAEKAKKTVCGKIRNSILSEISWCG